MPCLERVAFRSQQVAPADDCPCRGGKKDYSRPQTSQEPQKFRYPVCDCLGLDDITKMGLAGIQVALKAGISVVMEEGEHPACQSCLGGHHRF